MASDFGSSVDSAERARESLRTLSRDRARLAERVKTPRWYHPLVAALAAAAAIAPGLPGASGDSTWTVSVLACFVILSAVVPLLARRDGIAMSIRPTGRGTRLLLALQVATLLVLMLVAGAVGKLHLAGWLLAPIAVLAFVLTWFLGGRYDRAQRAELSSAWEAHR